MSGRVFWQHSQAHVLWQYLDRSEEATAKQMVDFSPSPRRLQRSQSTNSSHSISSRPEPVHRSKKLKRVTCRTRSLPSACWPWEAEASSSNNNNNATAAGKRLLPLSELDQELNRVDGDMRAMGYDLHSLLDKVTLKQAQEEEWKRNQRTSTVAHSLPPINLPTPVTQSIRKSKPGLQASQKRFRPPFKAEARMSTPVSIQNTNTHHIKHLSHDLSTSIPTSIPTTALHSNILTKIHSSQSSCQTGDDSLELEPDDLDAICRKYGA